MWVKRGCGRGRARGPPVPGGFGAAESVEEEEEERRKRVQSTAQRELQKAGESNDIEQLSHIQDDGDVQDLHGDGLATLRASDRYKAYEKEFGREARHIEQEKKERLREENTRQIQQARDEASAENLTQQKPDQPDDTSLPCETAQDPLRSFLPSSFGPAAAPARKTKTSKQRKTAENTQQDVDADFATENQLESLPISSVAPLGSRHDALVSCISLDSSGSRLVTSSLDHTIRLWDFGSMDSRLQSFKSLEPLGSAFPIHTAVFSPTGGKILIAGGDNSAKVLDRDGMELFSTPSGDRYLHDMSNTPGHAAALLSAAWNPARGPVFATSSEDATIRLWDSSSSQKRHMKIYKLKNARGQKMMATALAYSHDGSRLAVGADNGSLSLYDPASYSLRPNEENRNAHPAAECTSLCFSSDGTCLLTRSTDDAMRIWDTRRMDDPLTTWRDLENVHGQTACLFSPDGNLCATGTSARRKGSVGARFVIFSRTTLMEVGSHSASAEHGSIVALRWQAQTNQILYGCADGSVHVLYDEERSTKGILRGMQKKAGRKEEGAVNLGPGKIYTPNALPMFRDDETVDSHGMLSRRREEKAVERRPRSSAGIVARPQGSTLATFIKQRKLSQTWQEEDPREALLKLEERARTNPLFTSGLPQTILADKTAQEEEAEEAEEQRTRRNRGMPPKKPRTE